MTNEQAKTIIESCDGIMWNRLTDAENEALYMAIEALTNNKKQTDSLIRTSTDSVSATDVIYRQDAIDAFTSKYSSLDFMEDGVIELYVETIENLPSAQPDKDMIHLQKEQAYMQGWEDGQNALREEIWEDGRDRLD